VVVGDSLTGHNTFLSWGFKVNTGANLLTQAIDWTKSHVWAPAVAGGALLVALLACCCKRKNKKKMNKVAPGEVEGMF
jgi:hypothetical protein